jgi:uncharacterized lipoprotein
MLTRLAIAGLMCVVAASLSGCSSGTDVSKAQNDAYHSHEAGPKPPPGAMKGIGQPGGPPPPAPGKS